MKKTLTLIAFAAMASACTHSNIHTGSIFRNSPNPGTAILGARQLDSAYNFMTKNSFSTTNLQPAGLISGYSDVLGANGQPYHGLYYLVYCNQFVNGLLIMNVTPNLYFDSTGASLPEDNYGYTGPNPTSDTTPRQSLAHLRSIYLGATWKGMPFGPLGNVYIDSTLEATMGYMDLAVIPNSGVTTYNKGLRKIWEVVPINTYTAPALYVDDSTGQSWTW